MSFSESVESRYDSLVAGAPTGPERAFRKSAWSRYVQDGLPDRRNEGWKYSSLNMITKRAWAQPTDQSIAPEVMQVVERWQKDFDVAVLVNGLMVQSAPLISQAVLEDDFVFEDGFSGLAAALGRAGYQVDVPEGVAVARPLLIVHWHSGETAWSSAVHRVNLGRGASLRLSEIFLGGAAGYLRSDSTRVVVSEDARLEWARIQQENSSAHHFSSVQTQLMRGGCLESVQMNCGASWSRSTLRAEILGPGAEAHVLGLSFGRDQQHTDQRIEIRHMAGHTSSSQLFKGILKDRARGVLNGKIYIAQNAQKVSSSQLNHNLLLSPGAEADTKPELEIYADDVKANHGASIGRLDEDKMFYLMSRGIRRDEAQRMLSMAFVEDVVMKIHSKELRGFVEDRLGGLEIEA